jgi:hypothetical protein
MTEAMEGRFYVDTVPIKANDFLTSQDRLIQLAILGQLRDLTQRSRGSGGVSRLPSLKIVLRQPDCPILMSSINPVTGKPFKFDGSADDVWVTYGREGPLTFVPVLEDGKRFPNWVNP